MWQEVDFNSHAHVERDTSDYLGYYFGTISTHTLTWSVTNLINHIFRITQISTHTLTWSVTSKTFINYIAEWISTHTLTWSVTILFAISDTIERNFNSHAHVERDLGYYMLYYRYGNFNSHAHVERDVAGGGSNQGTEISTHTLTWSVTHP